MKDLIAGYHRFRDTQWPAQRGLFETLADRGQSPRAMVVACSDSRADPAMIFGASPGELFTIRNVGSLIPPFQPDAEFHGTSAALEFGVRVLEVRDLVVMGHAMCGGVRALLDGPPPAASDFVGRWMDLAARARDRVLVCEPADLQTACEHEVVKVSLENLMTFPWIAERVRDRKLVLHGATFDIRSGILSMLRPDGAFAPVP